MSDRMRYFVVGSTFVGRCGGFSYWALLFLSPSETVSTAGWRGTGLDGGRRLIAALSESQLGGELA